MREKEYDAVVIGGGAAGMAAADTMAKNGLKAAVLERENRLGGILTQCIHNGFGLHYFKEELTGPEYAHRFMEKIKSSGRIEVFPETTVTDVSAVSAATGNPGNKVIYAYSQKYGVLKIKSPIIILAMGSRERNRGNIGIPGTRPAGIFTAGLAQRFVNIEGYSPGEKVVIIGSGDIGLIMARRMTWIGAKVEAVIEIQPYPSGLTRNVVQCLNDFSIPLYLSHVVSRIYGPQRVEAVDVTPVKEGKIQADKTFKIDCDTILLSVGLVPENELSKKFGVLINPETGGAFVDAHLMTSVEGVFACGNVLHIHDLVDYVTEEAAAAADFAVEYLNGKLKSEQFKTEPAANVKYVLPNEYNPERDNRFFLRSLIVKNGAKLLVKLNGETVREKRLLHVQPSEMVSLTLKGANLAKYIDSKKENKLEFSIY